MSRRYDDGGSHPFSVVIPVYNEQDIIVDNTQRLIDYLDHLDTPYEIIIGSNGSTDRTPELGRQLATRYRDVKFFHLSEKGPGAAFGKAISMTLYDHIVSVDMDLSVDLGFIRRANTLLGEYAVVVGSKRMGTQTRSAVRKVASNAFILSAIVLLGLSYDDYSLAAKAYRKKVLLDCVDRIDRGTFYVVEVLNYAIRHEYPTVQIPAPCRDERKSRFNLFHEGVYRFGHLFKLWLTQGARRDS
jgi:glycosyltransferase involved in cell wall biosynthesis